MAPNTNDIDIVEDVREPALAGVVEKPFDVNNNLELIYKKAEQKPVKQALVWRNIIFLTYVHLVWAYGWYIFWFRASTPGKIFMFAYGIVGGFGITAGAHRHWAHKAYKANSALKIILMLFQTIAFQNCIYEWVRDHRVHHKYTDTNADPHNSRRGFFFAHVGWLLVRKHPDVKEKGKTIYLEDLKADPIVMWQKRNYSWFMPMLAFVVPTMVQHLVFGQSVWDSWHMSITRWCTVVNITWLLNSAAHMWGWRPYDKTIAPTDTAILGFLCFGEGWHNYHHVFPWDYKTSELVDYGVNFTNAFIDFFAKLGWAYDLKTVSMEMVKARVLRTGDGSHPLSKPVQQMTSTEISDKFVEYVNHAHDQPESLVWGWDDVDMLPEDKEHVTIINKTD